MRTPLESYFYSLTLDGPDEEAGDVEHAGGWAGLLRGPFEITQREVNEYELSDEDVKWVRHAQGAIVRQDNYGFIDVSYYDSRKDLDESWAAVLEETGDGDGEGEDGYDEEAGPD